MPRRRNVTPDELAKIIKLRESNTSWLQIQHHTGVPRQIAKHAYMERQLQLSREELKKARERVATEDLRRHFDCLMKLAQSLVDVLDVPSFNDRGSANGVILNLLQTDILGECEAYRPRTEREIRRITYHNQLLFKSLHDHTREKIDLNGLLHNWKARWNACKESGDKLKEAAKEILSSILKEESKLRERILKGSKNEHVIERMEDGICHTVWQGIVIGELVKLIGELDKVEDKPDQEDKVDRIINRLKDEIASTIQLASQSDGTTAIIFGKTSFMRGPAFTNADLAREVIKICIGGADTLCRGNMVKSLANEVSEVTKAIEELEENLDSLILRPMLLNSPKCKLCPA